MYDEYNTEVELVSRERVAESGASFTGFVHRTQLINDSKYITLTYCLALGTCMADLNMDNYFINAIMWQPREDSPLDRVVFEHNQEDQNEAYETLTELLEMEERADDHEEETMTTTAGPKRMEVDLKQINSPTVVRKVVVTTIMEPKEHFKSYMLGGRLYKACGTLEKFKSSAMGSDMWMISEIREYQGGFNNPSTTYYGNSGVESREYAWKKVANFLETLQPTELGVINNWHCKGNLVVEDDELDMYGYGAAHYTQRVPSAYRASSYSAYKPPVAMLRTSGDDIGELLHHDTCELEVSRPDVEREMDILEYLEKKDEAETDDKPEAEISASIETGAKASGSEGSSDGSDDSSIVFCDCGSNYCTVCQELAFAGGYGFGNYLLN